MCESFEVLFQLFLVESVEIGSSGFAIKKEKIGKLLEDLRMWMTRNVKTLHNLTKLAYQNKRSLFAALNIIFNRVSVDRIKEVGPDRACAEWLMRNGAFIRWVGCTSFVLHYDHLPLNPKDTGTYKIEEIRGAEASISHHGFDHFCDCTCISTISLHRCWYLNDRALGKLVHLKDSLCDLELVDCPEITCGGLESLKILCNLKMLTLGKLERIKNLESAVEALALALPNCQIVLC